MAVSKAQMKATEKYIKKSYDEIKIRTPKGKKDIITAHAKAQNKSLNSFVNEAIDIKMERKGE